MDPFHRTWLPRGQRGWRKDQDWVSSLFCPHLAVCYVTSSSTLSCLGFSGLIPKDGRDIPALLKSQKGNGLAKLRSHGLWNFILILSVLRPVAPGEGLSGLEESTWEGLSGRPQAAKAVRGAALGWERHLHCSPQHSQAHSWAEVSLSSGSV